MSKADYYGNDGSKYDTGGASFEGYLVDDDKLETLNVARYKAVSGEKGAPMEHELYITPPNVEDGDFYGLEIFAHRNGDNGNAVVLCANYMKRVFERHGMKVPDAIASGKCPVCEYLVRMNNKQNDIKDQAERTKFWHEYIKPYTCFSYHKPTKTQKPKRLLMWIHNAKRDAENKEQLYLFDAPATVNTDGIEECTVVRGDFVDLADPKNPMVFCFKREGEGKTGTKYLGFKAVEAKGFTYPDSWAEHMPLFADVLKFHTEAEINELFDFAAPSNKSLPENAAEPTDTQPVNDEDIPF